MPRRPRSIEPGTMYFVTVRTFQGRYLLRPDPVITDVLGGCLARAAEKFAVDVFAFVALSNHVHLLCKPRDGRLAAFMQYFLGNAAKKVGPAVDWRGQLWERRYCASAVLDSIAAEDRLQYILSHGVKEGLVPDSREWPGLTCLPQLLGDPKRTFHWFDWSRRWRSAMPEKARALRYDRRWAEDVTLELMPLPHWSHLTPAERARRVVAILEEVAARAPRKSKPGAIHSLLQKSPHSRAKKLKRRAAPICHSSDVTTTEMARAAHRLFAAEFFIASTQYRAGHFATEFPYRATRPAVPPLEDRFKRTG